MDRIPQKVYCHGCKNYTNHGIIHSHAVSGGGAPDDLQWSAVYYIAQCLGCDEIAFIKEYGDETQVTPVDDGLWEGFVTYQVYPEEPKTKKETLWSISEREFTHVPDFVEEVYKEVVHAFNSKSGLLCAIGLRTIVEATCKDANIEDGPIYDGNGEVKLNAEGQPVRSKKLIGQINGLVEAGLIPRTHGRILHQIRDLGNHATHKFKRPSMKTLRQAIEIVENLLHNIYDWQRYDLFPKKDS